MAAHIHPVLFSTGGDGMTTISMSSLLPSMVIDSVGFNGWSFAWSLALFLLAKAIWFLHTLRSDASMPVRMEEFLQWTNFQSWSMMGTRINECTIEEAELFLYCSPVSDSKRRNQMRWGRRGGQDAEYCCWSEDDFVWVVSIPHWFLMTGWKGQEWKL